MASLPVRDPVGDHLLTPHNAVMVVVDYQPFRQSFSATGDARRPRPASARTCSPNGC
jgi:hypothetical protein